MSNTPIFTPTGGHFGFVRFFGGAPWFLNFFQFFLQKWDQEVSSDQFIWSSWWSETMTLYSPPLIVEQDFCSCYRQRGCWIHVWCFTLYLPFEIESGDLKVVQETICLFWYVRRLLNSPIIYGGDVVYIRWLFIWIKKKKLWLFLLSKYWVLSHCWTTCLSFLVFSVCWIKKIV